MYEEKKPSVSSSSGNDPMFFEVESKDVQEPNEPKRSPRPSLTNKLDLPEGSGFSEQSRLSQSVSVALGGEEDGSRTIRVLGNEDQDFVSNVIKTSRYTLLTFLPLNLFEQFHFRANQYFLFIGILQCFKAVSTTDGIPTIFTPLTFILFVSGLRAATEDYARGVNDREENDRKYDRLNPTKKVFEQQSAGLLRVGDIVRIKIDQSLPSDIIILKTAHARGHCFVETASLDGESSLKVKSSVIMVHDMLPVEEGALVDKLVEANWAARYEAPNPEFEQFKGRLFTVGDEDNNSSALESANLLLKGTVLKNTDWIIGMVAYTGADTKIRRSVQGEDNKMAKQSTIQTAVDQYLLKLFLFQVFLCVIGGIIAGVSVANSTGSWYLRLDDVNPASEGCLRFFTWYIILAQLVPISFQVSSEVVKTIQAKFIASDRRLHDEESGRSAAVQSSSLNEDLGQIQYIFSDKTGTLTQNKMEFKVAVIHTHLYGSMETEISKRVKARQGSKTVHRTEGWRDLKTRLKQEQLLAQGHPFSAREELLDTMWKNSFGLEQSRRARNFLLHMAISNTISPVTDPETGALSYQSSSPDELALCKWADSMGFTFTKRNPTTVKINKFGRGEDETLEFRHVASCDFNSKRKRVTIVYEILRGFADDDYAGEPRVIVMCKGADSSIWPLTSGTDKHFVAKIDDSLVNMSANGLRTLLIAFSCKPLSWWEGWRTKFNQISELPERGTEADHSKGGCSDDCRIDDLLKRVEVDADLVVLGATAIEDKLQDLVPEAIEDFLGADIKVWMLTGDKRETAKNIGLACNLIDPDMEELIDDDDSIELEDDSCEFDSRLIEITGRACEIIHNRDAFQTMFDLQDYDNKGCISSEDAIFLQHSLKLGHDEYLSGAFRHHSGTFTCMELFEVFKKAELTYKKIVEYEIMNGLRIASRLNLEEHPISMVVEGSALAVLYPRDVGSNSGQMHNMLMLERKSLNARLNRLRKSMSTGSHVKSNSATIPDHGANSEEEKQAAKERHQVEMQDNFFALAMQCKSVVACRLTPLQKATVVREVKNREQVVTLAIGDGANDEQMILQANVGIGLAGLEGTAASRAGDYVLSQFSHLHTLLFVHGVWSYNRMSSLTHYIFYKTSLTSLAMFMFGALSQFSGHQYFNDLIFQLYNIIFTAAPVMVIAIFDRRLSYKILEDNPMAYASLLGGKLFNFRRFSMWLLASWVHAFAIVLVCNMAMGVQDVAHEDGKTHGVWFTSTAVYIAIVVNATLQIFFETYSVTVVHVFFGLASLILLWTILLFFNNTLELNPTLYGVVMRLYSSPLFWFTLILAISIPLLITYAVKAYATIFEPSDLQHLAEARRDVRRKSKRPRESVPITNRLSRTISKLAELPTMARSPFTSNDTLRTSDDDLRNSRLMRSKSRLDMLGEADGPQMMARQQTRSFIINNTGANMDL